MILRLLSEVWKKHTDFDPKWKRKADDIDIIAQNLRFGRLWHGVVCRDDGQPQYDLPVWVEPAGAVCVPICSDGRISLLEQFRPVPRPGDTNVTWPPADLSTSGRFSWELPRGFPEPGESPEQVARREAEEELGWTVESVELLGECNSNTTFFVATQRIFLVKVQPDVASDVQPDHLEKIRRVQQFRWDEILPMISDGRIFCGFTMAALMTYHVWNTRRSNG